MWWSSSGFVDTQTGRVLNPERNTCLTWFESNFTGQTSGVIKPVVKSKRRPAQKICLTNVFIWSLRPTVTKRSARFWNLHAFLCFRASCYLEFFVFFRELQNTRKMRRLSQSLVVFFSETAGKMPRDDRWPNPLPCLPIVPHHSFQTRVRTQRLRAYSSSYNSRRLTSSRICSSKRSKLSSGAPCKL